MLISDTHNFIFIAIPKTGTHSVREILREYSTDEHVGNGGGVSIPHTSKFKAFEQIHHGHLTILQMASVVDVKKYFSFCVFRNPYSRAVSLWSFWTRYMVIKPDILTFFKDERIYNRILFKPQTDFITDSDGKIMIDYIIPFENYQQGMDYVLEKLQITPKQLSKINQSTHDEYQKYYDEFPELKDIIETRYQRDIEVYNNLHINNQ